MATFLKLENPPIKEIIFTISYNEIIDNDGLQRFVNEPKIKDDFKIVHKSIKKEIHINSSSDSAKLSSLHDGFIITSPNKKIIQIKKGSFSFHKVDGYCSYQELYENMIEYWELLDKSTLDDLIVNNISVRYINLILKDESENSQDLLTIYTKNEFEEEILNFRNYISFKHKLDKSLQINIFTANEENQNGIVLDITLTKSIIQKNSCKDFYEDLQGFRNIKNEVFFKCLTKNTIKKLNHVK
ncbi:MAG: TIGR04255 family protein [Flavobacterium sp.]|uniref:TIGR04255 family protein n=1 Tax=Flavobacterium sp. TaxID=239 RepID=UPI002621AFA2|nr:TIGR04255 family protein [Flavobacterium sp.]MDD5150944.1 TIGR04255 family protein [Flavobacterium sp.]